MGVVEEVSLSDVLDEGLVERVARAIYECGNWVTPWDRLQEWRREFVRRQAKAALAAVVLWQTEIVGGDAER